jgi:hypothetical protein
LENEKDRNWIETEELAAMYSNKKLVTENRDNAIDLLKKNDRKN